MEVSINKKSVPLKFNFKALFEANKKFSSKDENGNNLGDGATNLFTRLVMSDELVIPDIITVAGNVGKATEDDLFAAVDELTDNGEKIDDVLVELKDELKNSGFFVKSIKTQQKNLEEALPILEKKADTDEKKQQVESVKRIQKLLNDNL